MPYQFDWLDDLVLPVQITVKGAGDAQFLKAMEADNIGVQSACDDFSAPWPWLPTNIPFYGLQKPGNPAQIWFVGEPSGQEVQSWRDLVLAIGREQRMLTPMAESAVEQIDKEVPVAVFTTPSCPKCAQAVRLIGAMALRNPKISLYAIDLNRARELLARWDFQTLPAFVIADDFMVVTANEWILAQKIVQAGSSEFQIKAKA